jgi:hypothetical protein
VIRLAGPPGVIGGIDLKLDALREHREATLPLIAAGRYGPARRAA